MKNLPSDMHQHRNVRTFDGNYSNFVSNPSFRKFEIQKNHLGIRVRFSFIRSCIIDEPGFVFANSAAVMYQKYIFHSTIICEFQDVILNNNSSWKGISGLMSLGNGYECWTRNLLTSFGMVLRSWIRYF